MNTPVMDTSLIAACGLYCGCCSKFLKKACPGCRENVKASWCKIKSCCSNKGMNDCSDCGEYINVKDCGTYNNFIGRIFGLIFGTDRSLCISYIRQNGKDKFVHTMAGKGIAGMPAKRNNH